MILVYTTFYGLYHDSTCRLTRAGVIWQAVAVAPLVAEQTV